MEVSEFYGFRNLWVDPFVLTFTSYSLCPRNPRAEASPNKAKKQTNMGKLHLAAERGNIEECQKLLTEVVRSMKDPLGHKR